MILLIASSIPDKSLSTEEQATVSGRLVENQIAQVSYLLEVLEWNQWHLDEGNLRQFEAYGVESKLQEIHLTFDRFLGSHELRPKQNVI